MADEYYCWKCNRSLAQLLLPYGRYEQCPSCRTALHVCSMCEFYDPAVAKACRETIAEEVKDKTSANVCDYFKARSGVHAARARVTATQQSELNAVFGLDESANAGENADALVEQRQRQVDASKSELDALFGLDEPKDD